MGRIEISLDEYNSLKNVIKENEKKEAKFVKEKEELQERLACYADAIDYLMDVGFLDRIFKWNNVIADVIDISKGK